MRTMLVLTVALVGVVAAGCGEDDDREGLRDESGTTGATQVDRVAESASESDGQGEGATELGSVFDVSAEEISRRIEVPTAIGLNVARGLSMPDQELFLAQFRPDAKVTDPIVPTLTPTMAAFYRMFGRAGMLCESWPLDDVYVNRGGALTVGSCEGFYRTLPDAAELPTGVRLVRHLPISDGLATGMMHRYEASFAATHPEQSVLPIGFPASRSADVLAQTAVTGEFLARLQSAWDSRDPAEIGAIYADRATRHDGFVADRQGREQIADWHALLFDVHPSADLAITEEYASGLGPGALYTLTMQAEGAACTMELAAVWDLDDDGLIENEYVYYDAGTVLSCGWAAGPSGNDQ